eukprot:s1156_g48.t1
MDGQSPSRGARQGARRETDGAGGACDKMSLKDGGDASTLECVAVSSKSKLAANDLKAPEARRADQRDTKAVVADGRRRRGTERALAAARSRTKRADS